MNVDALTVQALADLLDDPKTDGATVDTVFTHLQEGAFKGFMLEFRKVVERPMDGREYELTRIAHNDGWTRGFELAMRLANSAYGEDEDAPK